MQRICFIVVSALLWIGLTPGGETGRRGSRLGRNIRWLCYYGDDRAVLAVRGYDVLVLEPDPIGDVTPEDKDGRLFLARIPVGEVELDRWYYPAIQGKRWVLEADPASPRSRLVDPRAEEWRNLLIEQIAANIMNAGYDGFLLDSMNISETLITRDLRRFIGVDDAVVKLVLALRRNYPEAVIVVNGGVMLAPMLARLVDGFVYESVLSTWKAGEDGVYGYGPVDETQKAWNAPRLRRLVDTGLPVMALEYADPGDPEESERLLRDLRKMGLIPFISVKDHDRIPHGGEPLPDE